MEVTHDLGFLRASRSINENIGFMLTSKNGSYCSFFNKSASRYHGLFYFDAVAMRMYKFIDEIRIPSAGEATSIKNKLYCIERGRGHTTETFTMPRNFTSLMYELNASNKIDLLLDCKETYDNREWGRDYELLDEKGALIIRFTKKTDRREDQSDNVKEFGLCLAVRSDSNSYEKIGSWVEKHYNHDEERKAPPFRRFVYNAVRLNGTRFVFCMSRNKDSAIKECNYLFENFDEVKAREGKHAFDILNGENARNVIRSEKIAKEVKIAYANAANSLNNLIIGNKKNYGMLAGLPWFFQFWARDTLVSLKAISRLNTRLAEKLLLGYLEKIESDGRISNLTGNHESISIGSSDAHGWLFFRCRQLVEKINKNKEIISSIKSLVKPIKEDKNVKSKKIKAYLKKCNLIISNKEEEYHKATYEIECSLEKCLAGLLKHHTHDNFEANGERETWMDTNFADDSRKGIRVEVQAFRLNIYKLLFEISQNQKYRSMENILKIKVRNNFWNGAILADGLGDLTIRPNIFIAAYIYQELLSKEEWGACFDNTLKSLWLEWGGLSTIDKSHPLFTETSTGEDIKSYHRGDSWFWINNLAAIILFRINKEKFRGNITKILEASTRDILWKGCIGCHSELSSAKELRGEGCYNQAWSSAMYMELVDEVFG